MPKKLLALTLVATIALSGCGSDSGSDSPSSDADSIEAPTTEPVPQVDVPSPAESNEAIKQAFEEADLEVCLTEDGNGYVSYGLDKCPTDAVTEADGRVSVHTYRTAEAQQADLGLQEVDRGLKAWSWKLNTIVLTESLGGPTADVQAKVDKAMENLGATVVFDNTEYAG